MTVLNGRFLGPAFREGPRGALRLRGLNNVLAEHKCHRTIGDESVEAILDGPGTAR